MCFFKVAQEKLAVFTICFKVLLWDSVELHSTRMRLSCTWRALVLQKQASTPTVIATWAIQTKILLKKITLTPNLNSTGTWKGNVDCQLLGKLGSVKCWISQDQVSFTAFFKYFTNTKQPCQKQSHHLKKIVIWVQKSLSILLPSRSCWT